MTEQRLLLLCMCKCTVMKYITLVVTCLLFRLGLEFCFIKLTMVIID